MRLHMLQTFALLYLSSSKTQVLAAHLLAKRVTQDNLAHGGECKTPYSLKDAETINKALERVGREGTQKRQLTANPIFDLYVNIVAANLTYAGGWVPNKHVEDQVNVLNAGYLDAGISFSLKGITRILSQRYHQELTVPDTDDHARMLSNFGKTFRKGDIKTLNVNLIGFTMEERTYGFALPPSFYDEYPELDGAFIRYTSLPGGSSTTRQGSTLIHDA